jgi:hypothetical protein
MTDPIIIPVNDKTRLVFQPTNGERLAWLTVEVWYEKGTGTEKWIQAGMLEWWSHEFSIDEYVNACIRLRNLVVLR